MGYYMHDYKSGFDYVRLTPHKKWLYNAYVVNTEVVEHNDATIRFFNKRFPSKTKKTRNII